jgi:hypothetical protein
MTAGDVTAANDGKRPVSWSVEGPEHGSREARAALALKLVAAAYIVGILLAEVRGSVPVANLWTVAFNLAAGVIAAVYVVVARGLDRRRPWAWAVVRPILVVLAIAGGYAAVTAAQSGMIRIPYEVVLAGWALLGPPDGAGAYDAEGADMRPDAGGTWRIRRRGVALLVVTVAMAGQMAFGHLLYAWGGVLDVHPPDLVASLEVSCGPTGEGLPPTVAISFSWSWARGAPLPNEVDTVLIGWSGVDAAGRPLYSIDGIPDTERGIRPGYGELTRPMVDAARATLPAAYRWAVDLGARGYAPGKVALGLSLSPRDVVPATGKLVVKATYVHLDQWQADTAITCTW